MLFFVPDRKLFEEMSNTHIPIGYGKWDRKIKALSNKYKNITRIDAKTFL